VERPVQVLIVEDHRLVAEGLISLLEEQPAVRVVGSAGSVAEAVAAAGETRPDVILMDYRLPDGDGTVAADAIRSQQPEVAVLFLSADSTDEHMLRAVEAGASGYISKTAQIEEVVEAIRRAAEGEFLLPPAVMSRLLRRQSENRRREKEQERFEQELTPREREILQLMAAGEDNHEIAEHLHIAYGTVRTHVRSLLEKLDSRSRLQAVVVARERRLVD
jgi:two-component system, NarL family, response regulator DevR